MTSVTLTEVRDLVAILREAARTEIMPRFRGLVPMRTRQKSSRQDLVTDADEAAEAAITAACLARFPGAAIVGEEAVSKDPAVLARLAEPGLAILVDPIDGTKNFASEVPCFGVMAAMVVRGEIQAAVILDPVEDDVALALRGQGAWRERADGRRVELRVSAPPATLREMAGTASWTFSNLPCASRCPAAFPGSRPRATIAAPRISTACSAPATTITRSTAARCPGTTRRAGCCIAKRAAMRPASTAIPMT